MTDLNKLNSLIRECVQKVVDDEQLKEDSLAAKAAKAKGLVYAAFGRWKDKATGKVVAQSDGDKLKAVKTGGDKVVGKPQATPYVRQPIQGQEEKHSDSDTGMDRNHPVSVDGSDQHNIVSKVGSLDYANPKSVNSYVKSLSNDDLAKHYKVASQEAVYQTTLGDRPTVGYGDSTRKISAQKNKDTKITATLSPAFDAERERRIALKSEPSVQDTEPTSVPDTDNPDAKAMGYANRKDYSDQLQLKGKYDPKKRTPERPPVASDRPATRPTRSNPAYPKPTSNASDEDAALDKWLSDMEDDDSNSDIEPGTRY